MPKIKCPHCGSNNQDVTEKDRCWQCNTVLGAAPAVVEPAAAATVPTPVQKQVEPASPVPVPGVSSPQRRFPAATVPVMIVLLLIVIGIVLLVLKK